MPNKPKTDPATGKPYKHGGPRPNAGGKREGAGRKPAPAGTTRTERVVLLLTPSEAAAVDAARGDASRPEWCRARVLAPTRTKKK